MSLCARHSPLSPCDQPHHAPLEHQHLPARKEKVRAGSFDMYEKRQDPCVHMERGAESPGTYRKMAEFLCTRGRKGRSPACTDSQNLHTHRGPVYTWRKEQGPLHKRRGAGFHCTHTRGVEFLCQHRERKGRGRGMVLLCTHREGLWILTGIPGSPEGPASPSSPALPCRSEESENAMSPLSTPGALPAVPPFSGEKATTHRFSLLAFGPSSAREPLQDRNQGLGQVQG